MVGAVMQEIEIKLSVGVATSGELGSLLASKENARQGSTRKLLNRYYDTSDARLQKHKVALRVRESGKKRVQTLKTAGGYSGGAHCREEFEWTLSNDEPVPDVLGVPQWPKDVDFDALRPVFNTNFTRLIYTVTTSNNVVEIAIDHGQISSGSRSSELSEIEFELKSGSPACLLELAGQVAAEVPVFLNLLSKAEQGYYLAGLYSPEMPCKREPLTVAEFLRVLSFHWLLDEPFRSGAYNLSAIEMAVDKIGSRELWQNVIGELDRGTTVRDLSENSTQLGVLQLQLAAAER